MDAQTVALLEELLEAARNGQITDVFVVHRYADGEHGHCFMADDLGDLLMQVRTEVIRAQIDMGRAAKPDVPH